MTHAGATRSIATAWAGSVPPRRCTSATSCYLSATPSRPSASSSSPATCSAPLATSGGSSRSTASLPRHSRPRTAAASSSNGPTRSRRRRSSRIVKRDCARHLRAPVLTSSAATRSARSDRRAGPSIWRRRRICCSTGRSSGRAGRSARNARTPGRGAARAGARSGGVPDERRRGGAGPPRRLMARLGRSPTRVPPTGARRDCGDHRRPDDPGVVRHEPPVGPRGHRQPADEPVAALADPAADDDQIGENSTYRWPLRCSSRSIAQAFH